MTARIVDRIRQLIFLIFLLGEIRWSSASVCVVSKWSDWSSCQGNCDFGQKVRNRDVLRPPFPEKRHGDVLIHECPPLYEAEFCMPEYCNDEDGPFQYVHKKNMTSIETEEVKKIRHTTEKPFFSPKTIPKVEKLPLGKKGVSKNPKAAAVKTVPIVKIPSDWPKHNCRRIHRNTCANKPYKPQYVIRWYRMSNEPFCRTYHYAFCNQDIEDKERPIGTEQECQELCFSQEERIILPQFRIL